MKLKFTVDAYLMAIITEEVEPESPKTRENQKKTPKPTLNPNSKPSKPTSNPNPNSQTQSPFAFWFYFTLIFLSSFSSSSLFPHKTPNPGSFLCLIPYANTTQMVESSRSKPPLINHQLKFLFLKMVSFLHLRMLWLFTGWGWVLILIVKS